MLAEASTELGGRINHECRLPGLAEWVRVRDYRVHQIQTMPNVDIFLDNHLQAEDCLSIGADHIVIATGSKWHTNGFGRYHHRPCPDLGPVEQIFTPDDIFKDRVPRGRALIFDDDHYYMGSVLAEMLVVQGVEVCFVTPENLVSAWGVMTDEQYQAQQRLIELGVKIITAHGLDAYDGSTARLSCVYTGRSQMLATDALVLVTSRYPVDGLYKEIASKVEAGEPGSDLVSALDKIGDCNAPAIIAAAVYAGHRYARELGTDTGPGHVIRYDKLFDPD